MHNRSVDDQLSRNSKAPLSWTMRLKVAQDVARGLTYLHEEMDRQIIFRDLKPSNILLDDQWNAKLSDFKLAHFGPEEGLTHVSTEAVGTIGYAAPEYIQTGRLTSKVDVWSYGVFLYELITGRRPMERTRPKNERKLLEWVKPYVGSKEFRQIIDPRLKGNYSLESANKLAYIANMCLSIDPKSRPKMSEAYTWLTNSSLWFHHKHSVSIVWSQWLLSSRRWLSPMLKRLMRRWKTKAKEGVVKSNVKTLLVFCVSVVVYRSNCQCIEHRFQFKDGPNWL